MAIGNCLPASRQSGAGLCLALNKLTLKPKIMNPENEKNWRLEVGECYTLRVGFVPFAYERYWF